MKNILIICLLLPISLHLYAQEIVVAGKIIDKQTKAVVPFANISIIGQALGTVSNDKGEFEFHIPTTYQGDSLGISCLGYFRYSIAIKDIHNKQAFNILLKPREYLLNEFTVRPQELTPLEIVEQAIKRISNNYISQPSLMDGFYREYFKENEEYVAFAEAAISIYDIDGYDAHGSNKQKRKETISLNQLRVSDIYNKGDYVLYIDLNYVLRGNLVRNKNYWESSFKKAKYKIATLTMDSISYYGDDLVYCIQYKIDNKRWGNVYEGRLYIRTNDFAILRTEVTAYNSLKGRETNGAPHRSTAIMTYKEHKGKLYLNYVNANHDIQYQIEEIKYNLHFYSELLIHDINTDNPKSIASNKKMEETSIFYQPRYRTYNPDFWTSYQMFENSPANLQIITDLEKLRPLEEHYKANGKLKIQKQHYGHRYSTGRN